MSYSYAMDKVNHALEDLVGTGSVQQRLHSAVSKQLCHISPKADLPVDLHRDFQQLMQSCQHAQRRSDGEAQQCAHQILALHKRMQALQVGIH